MVRQWHAGILLIAGALAGVLRADVVEPPRYTVQVTGIAISPTQGYVVGFNNSAEAAYWNDLTSNQFRGYFWDGIQSTPLQPTNVKWTIPRGLNNSGVIAGYYGQLTVASTAAYWDESGKHDLSGLGGAFTYADGINDQNVIVGHAQTGGAPGQLRLVNWDNSGIHDLGPLLTIYEEIIGFNNANQILGQGQGGTGAWIWNNGQYSLLQDLQGAYYSKAYAINDAGVAVGMSWPNQTGDRAVVWRAGWTLAEALPLPATVTRSRAHDVNNQGEIVGRMEDPSDPHSQAVLWRNNSHYLLGVVDSDLNWEIRDAWFVNDVGQILALGWTESLGYRELVLTPVPEPGIAAVLAVGFFAMSRRPRARMRQKPWTCKRPVARPAFSKSF